MRIKRTLLTITIVLSLALVFGVAGVAQDEKPIKVGAVNPLTGPLASWGEPVTNGLELGVKHLNQAGGPLGREIQMLVRDTKTDATTGSSAARNLVDVNNVPVILGPLATTSAVAIAEGVTIPNEVVQISSCTGIPYSNLEDSDYAFRTSAPDSYQGKLLGELAWDVGYKKLGVLYVKNQYGEGLANSAVEAFEAKGGEVLNEVSFAGGRSSYRGELNAVTNGNPDAVLIIGFPENVITIVRQSLKAQIIDNFLFGDAMYGQDIIDRAGGARLDGTYGVAAGTFDTPSLSTFAEEYEKEFGKKPDKSFIANNYDAAVVMGLAIQHAGKPTSEAVRDSLREVANPPGEKIYAGANEIEKGFNLLSQGEEINYVGASGPIDFDKNGDVTSPMQVFNVKDGELVRERTIE